MGNRIKIQSCKQVGTYTHKDDGNLEVVHDKRLLKRIILTFACQLLKGLGLVNFWIK